MIGEIPTNVPTRTWSRAEFGLRSTVRVEWEDDDTEIELAPAGALAPRETLPPIDPAFLADVATETAAVLLAVATSSYVADSFSSCTVDER